MVFKIRRIHVAEPVANLMLLIVMSAAICIAVLSSPASNQADETVKFEQQMPPIKEGPILYDFEHFRQSFHKKYGSRLEVTARKFYYYATLFKVYVSGVAFKFWQASSYLAVNEFSDWSRRELAMMENEILSAEHDFRATKIKQEVDLITELNDLDTFVDGLNPEQLGEIADELEQEAKEKLADVSAVDLLEGNKRGNRQKRDVNSKTTLPSLKDQVKLLDFCTNRMPIKLSNHDRLPSDQSKKGMFSDLRGSGCMFPPGHQRRCGSCYAFASIAVAEFYYCKSTGDLVKMSEDYMIDCGKAYMRSLHGCDGGRPFVAASFIENFGLELARHEPYAGREKRCKYRDPFEIEKTGYYRMSIGSTLVVDSADWQATLMLGNPILVAVKTYDDFQRYGGGVYDGSGCHEKASHVMVVVGSGQDYGQEFWLLRNSFGADWGDEGGHFKLAKSATEKCIEKNRGFVYGTRNGYDYDNKPSLNGKLIRRRVVVNP